MRGLLKLGHQFSGFEHGKEDRILITFDKDFGELAFRIKLPAETQNFLFFLHLWPIRDITYNAADFTLSANKMQSAAKLLILKKLYHQL